MRESLLVVPTHDNNGVPLGNEILKTAKRLAKQFGGVTSVRANGMWIDPATGNLYDEEIVQLFSAYDETKPQNDACLAEIADWTRANARQLAIYVRYASGNVEVRNGESK